LGLLPFTTNGFIGQTAKKADRQLRKNGFVKLQYLMGVCGKERQEMSLCCAKAK
jgi:hypothetical protein